MKKRVGIVTFHNAHNYGAVLQAYALSKKIESYGFDVEFIKSDKSYIQNHYRKTPFFKENNTSYIKYAKNIIHYLLDFNRINKRYNSFKSFIEINFKEVNISNKNEYFDYVVLGSDQIWNCNITKGFDPLFFGSDVNLSVGKIISYAASMGNATKKSYLSDDFNKLISNIDVTGVREQELQELISDRNDVSLNLDPTLLLEKNMWSKVKSEKKKNIIIYEVYKSQETELLASYLKNKYKLEVKVILSGSSSIFISDDVVATASPDDFIDLFRTASFVITTSFHGTVFSIINNVPFYTLKINDGVDKRSANLLKQLGLSSRHVSSLHEAKMIDEEIDFGFANKQLEKLQLLSDSYLRSSLDI